MFRYFSSLIIIIFEAVCCKMFFESFYESSKKKNWKKMLYFVLLVFSFYICALLFSQWIILKQLTAILLTGIVARLYFKTSFKKAVILAILYHGLVWLTDFIVYVGSITFFFNNGEVKQEYALEGNLMICLSKIILILCILLIKKYFWKKSTEVLADTEWTRFLFFPVFTIITIASIIMTFHNTQNQAQANVLYTIAFGMVGMNVFVYYLINDIIKREAKLHEKELLELQVKNQMETYRSISENYETQKSKAHEFKNQILCIQGLLKEKEYSQVIKYVEKISETVSDELYAIDTNHIIINAILNAKYQEATKKNIVFVFKINDLSKIKMDDEDLVVLLANLLNNSIEACEKCNDRKIIKFKFMIEEDTAVLSVKNTCEHPPIYENDEIKTSKNVHPDEHGVGIKNIIKVIKKYNGSYIIQNNNHEFYFSILLPV